MYCKTLPERTGTAFARWRTPETLIETVLMLGAHGGPRQATVAGDGLDTHGPSVDQMVWQQLLLRLVLLPKTAVMSEWLSICLNPDFRLTQMLPPYAQKLMLRQFALHVWAPRVAQANMDFAHLMTELSQSKRRITRQIEQSDRTLHMRLSDFTPLVVRFEKLVNRLILAIIFAAFIIELAVLLSGYSPIDPEQWLGSRMVVGFTLVSLLGIFQAWNFLRSGVR